MAEKSLEEQNAELQEQLAASLKVVDEQKEFINDLVNANSLLEKEIADASKIEEKPGAPTFEHEGKTYELLVAKTKVLHEGEVVEMSAADLLATPEVLAHLVKVDSGLIKEVK